MKRLLGFVTALMVVVGVSAQSDQAPGTVTGRWVGKALRTQVSFPLTFTLEGTKLSGTFDGKPVEGELIGKTFTFGSADAWRLWRAHKMGSADSTEFYQTINFAVLEGDGTLSGLSSMYMRGYGDSYHKDGYWTAIRAIAQ